MLLQLFLVLYNHQRCEIMFLSKGSCNINLLWEKTFLSWLNILNTIQQFISACDSSFNVFNVPITPIIRCLFNDFFLITPFWNTCNKTPNGVIIIDIHTGYKKRRHSPLVLHNISVKSYILIKTYFIHSRVLHFFPKFLSDYLFYLLISLTCKARHYITVITCINNAFYLSRSMYQ